jgi:hypothetical protein
MIYKLTNFRGIEGMYQALSRIDDDGKVWAIPSDEQNRDYQEYLKWLSEGNTPEAAE